MAESPDKTTNGVHKKSVPTVRHKTTTVKPPPYTRARILWPALGFPEVIAPTSPVAVMNGTNCIELLLLSERDDLTKKDVSRHLRYVTWGNRHCRYLDANHETCSFPAGDIEVKPVQATSTDEFVQRVLFASEHVLAGLARFVREFYAQEKVNLKHLFQIRVYEKASSKLSPDLYNLFWVNENPNATPDTISAEMRILKEHFAHGRRVDKAERWRQGAYTSPPVEEYVYDYAKEWLPKNRTEVLHPLLVMGEAENAIRIGHLTDTHLCVRADLFETNLGRASVSGNQYNNWNTRFMESYFNARKNCRMLVITGDIVDYGSGHRGRDAPPGKIRSYQLDRNWFLFYSVLASGDNYQVPVYTVLGNHDWRLNPYPPLSRPVQLDKEMNLSRKELELIHGEDADNWFTYGAFEEVKSQFEYLPLFTMLDSIKWYLLLINPFLDYTAHFPGGYSFLLLDWAKEETTPQIDLAAVLKKDAGVRGLPVASGSLTENQKAMAEWFVERDAPAKVLALHSSIVSPWPEMPGDTLRFGVLDPCPYCGGTANLDCACLRLGVPQTVGKAVYPVLALNHPAKEETAIENVDMAVYGTIGRHRDWLIKKLRAGAVALVLSGHTHRDSVFVVVDNGDYAVGGDHQVIHAHDGRIDVSLFSRSGQRIAGHRVPPGTAVRIFDSTAYPFREPKVGPLFVNTTSTGPMGKDMPISGKKIMLAPAYAEVLLKADGTIEAIVCKKAELKMFHWESWIRKQSRANYVKLHKGGIVAGYDHKQDAVTEKGADSPWYMAGKQADGYADYECWIRKSTKATGVKLYGGGIIGEFESKEEAEAEKGQDEPWQKWLE